MLEKKTYLMLCTLCYAACLVLTQSEFDVGIGQQQQTTFGQKVDEVAVKVSFYANYFI